MRKAFLSCQAVLCRVESSLGEIVMPRFSPTGQVEARAISSRLVELRLGKSSQGEGSSRDPFFLCLPLPL